MGYVTNPIDQGGVDSEFVNSGSYEVEVACKRSPAQASLEPLYAPGNERIKS